MYENWQYNPFDIKRKLSILLIWLLLVSYSYSSLFDTPFEYDCQVSDS